MMHEVDGWKGTCCKNKDCVPEIRDHPQSKLHPWRKRGRYNDVLRGVKSVKTGGKVLFEKTILLNEFFEKIKQFI